MSEEIRTAAWWVKSNHADAVNWRKEAEYNAFQNVVLQAQADVKNNQGKWASIPICEIPRPPVGAGRYFTMPSDNERGAPPSSIPQDAPPAPKKAAVTEQASRITRPVDISNDWLAETEKGYVTFVMPTEDK